MPICHKALEGNCIEYKYLGIKLTHDGTLDSATNERNTQGRRAIEPNTVRPINIKNQKTSNAFLKVLQRMKATYSK